MSRLLFRVLIAAVLLVGEAVPVSAQDAEVVVLAFELTLDGDAPEGEEFTVALSSTRPDGGHGDGFFALCGDDSARRVAPNHPLELCVGNGAALRIEFDRVLRGTTIEYTIRRQSTEEVVARGTEELEGDTTVRASYNFGHLGDEQQDVDTRDEQQGQPGMPATGGGAADGPPMGRLAVVGFVIVAGLCSTARRRWVGHRWEGSRG